jgi:spore coat protein Y
MGCGKKRRDDLLDANVGDVFDDNGFRDCVCDVVAFIDDIQDAVEENDLCPTNCLNPILGDVFNQEPRANTRPFVLYTEEGKLFKAFFKPVMHTHEKGKGFEECDSPFFRVESVNDCCAVLRVLQPTDEFCDVVKEPQEDLVATNSCITVDLRCFCAIQCLDDIFLRGV